MSGKGNETNPIIPDWLKPDAQPFLREQVAAARTHNERLRGADTTGNPFGTEPLDYKFPQPLKKPGQ